MIPRLEIAILQKTAYTDPETGEDVGLYFHHPTQAEKTAAFALGGMLIDEKGEPYLSSEAKAAGGSGFLLAQHAACVHCARFCVERVDGLDLPSPLRVEYAAGLEHLSDEAARLIHPQALQMLGSYLLEASTPGEDEKKL